MRRAAWLTALLGVLAAPAARADLVAKSRNSVVFVESTREGEEWEAFRLVDPRAPAVYHVEGPGRVLLRVRTLPRAEPVDAIAAVLEDTQVTLTLRVPATPDPQAQLSDAGGRPSLAKLYLLEIGEGTTRVTVRHSEGPALLVAARFAPPLEAAPSDTGVPLVAPRIEPPRSVPRVGALERGSSLATGPVAPDPEARPIEAPLPDGDADPDDPVGDTPEPRARPPREASKPPPSEVESHPAFDERLDLDAAPTGRGAALLLEVRAGTQLERVVATPGLGVGLDFRGALFPRSSPRSMDVGVSLDIGYARDDRVVRLAGAPVDVARISHMYGALTADLRVRLYSRPGVASVYGSAGGGVLLGRASVHASRGDQDAGSAGFLGAARLGAALGSAGSRPFLELAGRMGRLESEVLRDGPAGAPGDGVVWYSVGVAVGWRVELGFLAAAEGAARPAKAGEAR